MKLRDQQHAAEWPYWMAVGTGGLAVLFAVLTMVVPPRLTHPVGLALLSIAVVPWLVEAAGVPLRRLLFAFWALIPLATLNVIAPLGLLGEPPPDYHDIAQFSLMLLILLVGQVATTSPRRVALPVAAGAIAVGLLRAIEHPAHLGWVLGMGFALACGLLLHRMQGMVGQLRVGQAALAREAALEERQRIAREVHDVVAHTLSVTMLHLSAARMALERSPTKAADALAEAERLGRQSLADIRRTVGLLRGGHDAPTAPPLPGMSDLQDLVDGYAAAGLVVDGMIDYDLAGLDAAAGLAAYRIVQEALANVVKHAPGARVSVVVTVVDGDASITVRNDAGHILPAIARWNDVQDGQGDVGGSGLGLQGMRERVEPLGGTVTAGPDGAGWTVTARIPLVRDSANPQGGHRPASGDRQPEIA